MRRKSIQMLRDWDSFKLYSFFLEKLDNFLNQNLICLAQFLYLILVKQTNSERWKFEVKVWVLYPFLVSYFRNGGKINAVWVFLVLALHEVKHLKYIFEWVGHWARNIQRRTVQDNAVSWKSSIRWLYRIKTATVSWVDNWSSCVSSNRAKTL